MADTTFIDYQTVVQASWLNDVNRAVYKDFVNVKNYGATGDGVTDDTAALIAAEAAATAASKSIFVPPGIYKFNDYSWNVHVNVFGYGAKIQSMMTVYAGNADATVRARANDIIIAGLSVDSNSFLSGFSSDGFSRVTFLDCTAMNCRNVGFGSWDGDQILVSRCSANNIRYQPGNTPADGFYFGACTRSSWVDCRASDFRRIGFVSEGNGGTDSNHITAQRCVASGANNCDDSPTEYNAGFWAENTNNVSWLDCKGDSLAGNAGQTSGRVRGMVVIGLGNGSRGKAIAQRCYMRGGLGRIPIAYSAQGTSDLADVVIEDCYAEFVSTGIHTLGNLRSLTIDRFRVHDISANDSGGGVLVDGGGNTLFYLNISKLDISSGTFTSASGWINIFSAPASCTFTLRDTFGASIVTKQPILSAYASRCSIVAGAVGYGSFNASRIELVDCDIGTRNGTDSDAIAQGSALTAGSELIIRGGWIHAGAAWTPEFGGSNLQLRCHGVRFTNYGWEISTSGTFTNEFRDCKWELVPPTVGCIRTNFAAPTKQVLIVQDCYFESANAADTPIRLWNVAPTNAILQGNVRKVATNLHNLGAVTSDVNNIAV